MLRVRRAQPQLESLEGRYAPATIKLIGGNLFISNNASATLTVTATANNTFKVQDGLKTVAGLKAGSLVSITSSNKSDVVTFDVSTFKFTGNLLVNSQNGNDIVSLKSAGGAIGGNVTLLTGLGNDTVNYAGSTGKLTIGGNLTAYDNLGLADKLNIMDQAGFADSIGGNLTAFGYNGITLGDNGSLDTIGGAVNISTPNDGAGQTVGLADKLSVGKDMSVLGGSGPSDSFNLGGATIGGNLSVNLAAGANNFFGLGQGTVPSLVAGNVYLTGNSAVGAVQNDNTAFVVAGSMYVNLGNGDYDVLLGIGADIAVGGNLNLTMGNGNNNAVPDFISGSVAGNINLTFGNGDNDFTVVNAPGGTVFFRGGNGTNILQLGNVTGSNMLAPTGTGGDFIVNAVFGSGNDTLELDTGAAQTLSGKIDFDGDATGDSLTVIQGLLSPTLVIVGLP